MIYGSGEIGEGKDGIGKDNIYSSKRKELVLASLSNLYLELSK